jgi:hypothetical protein
VTYTGRNSERRAKEGRRAPHIALKKKLPNPSRARSLSLFETFRNYTQRNPIGGKLSLEVREISLSLVADSHILSHHQLPRAESFHKDSLNKLLGGDL